MSMRVLQALKLPIYAAQIFSGAKSFQKNPILGSRRLNARGLHVIRVKWAMKMAAWRRTKLAPRISVEQVAQYQKNGYVLVENFLPQELFDRVNEELKANDFIRYDMVQGQTVTRRVSLDDKDLATKPALRSARNDRRLLNLIRYVASYGGQPLVSLQIVLAQPGKEEEADPQVSLHSDTFHPTAKSWLFLQDVGEEDGPLCYVQSSHKMTKQRYAWEKSISENVSAIDNTYSARGSMRVKQDQLNALGYPEPTKMVVKANTLVVADTHGFHARCFSPKPTTRIEIYGSLRRNPFLPVVGLHPPSLFFLRDRMNSLMIDGLALLHKLGMRANPWQSKGAGKVDEWPLPKQ